MATIFRPIVINIVYPPKKAQAEYVVTMSVLLTPNPAFPWHQDTWPRPAQPLAKAVGEAVGAINVLYSPNPANPFNVYEWRSAAAPRIKAIGVATSPPSPLLTPNPARPFSQGLWPNAVIGLKPARVDTVELLLPIYSAPPSFGNPTETRSFKLQSVRSDIHVNLLPLQYIPPFRQFEWQTAAPLRLKAVGEGFASLQLFAPPPPTPLPDSGQPGFIRDPWDRDEWGNFIPGAGMHQAV